MAKNFGTVLLVGAALAGAFLFIGMRPKTGQIYLFTGDNIVNYGGGKKLASDAFDSIWGWLIIAYYWNTATASWDLVTGDMLMVPGGIYNIQVTQDCIWTY